MALDNGDTVVANAKNAAEAITDIGSVFDHKPLWKSSKEFSEDTSVIIDSKEEHRFCTIDHWVDTEPFTNRSTRYIHRLSITVWVSAKIDFDHLEVSRAACRTMAAAVLNAFSSSAPLEIGLTNTCGYSDEGRPKYEGVVELRRFYNYVWHTATIELAFSEEVTHG